METADDLTIACYMNKDFGQVNVLYLARPIKKLHQKYTPKEGIESQKQLQFTMGKECIYFETLAGTTFCQIFSTKANCRKLIYEMDELKNSLTESGSV